MTTLSWRRLHFVGIGGAGMAVLAEWLHGRGVIVSGSDLARSAVTEHLRAQGITIAIGPHDRRRVDAADAVVYTAAAPSDNPELAAARERGIPLIRRAELLGLLTQDARAICVGGAHGKTTTTAMCGAALAAGGLDPTVLVGGTWCGANSGLRLGRSPWIVTEADEFDRSFLTLTPEIAVITNVDREHLDTYGTVDAIQDAFVAFAARTRASGCIVLGIDSPLAAALAPRLVAHGRVVTFATGQDTWLRAVAIEPLGGGMRFTCRVDGGAEFAVQLAVPGLHNVRNALAALAVAHVTGVDLGRAAEGLATFRGMSRRCETIGERDGVVFVDDYAHHPTEVDASLAALRAAYPGRRLVVLFQPHLFTRTRDQAADFGRALAAADTILLAPIYPSREHPIAGVTSAMIASAAAPRDRGRFHLLADDAEIRATLAATLRAGDLCVTMGAGDVRRFAEHVLVAS